MDVLSSRTILRPSDPQASKAFYRDVLGLAIYREFGDPADLDVVFFMGSGLLEISAHADGPMSPNLMLWLQVRDVGAEHKRLVTLGVQVQSAPQLQPWGLIEMIITDPDGLRIFLVEVPAQHPLRRDLR